MTKKIKLSTNEKIKEWFDVRRYSDLSTYTVGELADELERRHEQWRCNRTGTFFDVLQQEKFMDIQDFPLIRQFPSKEGMSDVEWSRQFRSGAYMDDQYAAMLEEMEQHIEEQYEKRKGGDHELLRDMWLGSILNELTSLAVSPTCKSEIDSAFLQDVSQRGHKLDIGESPLRLNDLMTNGAASKGFITADFNFTDAQLVDAFKKAIPVYRKLFKLSQPKRKLTDYSISMLKTSPIIPFIDLLIWADLNDYEITDAVYASVLYPDGRYGTEKIKDSLRPSATTILEPQFLFALRELAIEECSNERE
ncbi:DUF6387 family protein [Endozoicomonas atrinae]|uniref:DUF6387 family protein n=1 Tax=Endozoicomonas atrinae TaxID=1333660 RepID=UPI003AFFE3EF